MDRYKEALERAKAGKPMDEVFPELKESEDERIRKALIQFLTNIKGISESGRTSWAVRREDSEMCNGFLAYLEKQKEQKSRIDACGFPLREEGESACSYLERCLAPDMRNIWYEACSEIKEKQKEQKPNIELIQRSWYMEGYRDREFGREPKWVIKTGEGGPKYEKNEKYGQPREQKPAEWSEDDKRILDEAIGMIEANGCWVRSDDAVKQVSDFLKSLPGIFNLQPKEEWSEEDEKMRNAILQDLANIKAVYPKINIQYELDWLKSLRPSWKPSNLELGALRTAISVLTEERNFQRAGKHLQDILDHFEGKETRHDWKPSEAQIMALKWQLDHQDLCKWRKDDLQSLYDELKKRM